MILHERNLADDGERTRIVLTFLCKVLDISGGTAEPWRDVDLYCFVGAVSGTDSQTAHAAAIYGGTSLTKHMLVHTEGLHIELNGDNARVEDIRRLTELPAANGAIIPCEVLADWVAKQLALNEEQRRLEEAIAQMHWQGGAIWAGST